MTATESPRFNEALRRIKILYFHLEHNHVTHEGIIDTLRLSIRDFEIVQEVYGGKELTEASCPLNLKGGG